MARECSHININTPTAISTFPCFAGPTYHHTFPILTQHHSHFSYKLTLKPFTSSWTSSMEFAPFVESDDSSSTDIDQEILLELRRTSWLSSQWWCFSLIEFFNSLILLSTTTLAWMTSWREQEWYHLYWRFLTIFSILKFDELCCLVCPTIRNNAHSIGDFKLHRGDQWSLHLSNICSIS